MLIVFKKKKKSGKESLPKMKREFRKEQKCEMEIGNKDREIILGPIHEYLFLHLLHFVTKLLTYLLLFILIY